MNKKYEYFRPKKMSSWWCTLEDILWPEKKITDRIKRRAEGFSRAGIDTAINYGFHARFDYSDYFGSLHGYLADVCNELHKYGIKFMDHYSCNLVQRPRGDDEFKKLHATQRHHILLHPDSLAVAHAQYAGYMFQDICESDVRDGSRGYSWRYQAELFCHNNPKFLDMHTKYLGRLLSEVPIDGIEVDDMCDYGGFSTCACQYCRARFYRDYGHELPSFEDKTFWGNTSGDPCTWGNYNNPVFKDWIRMREDSVADHVKLIKNTIGNIPLMTCCSSTGPILLNAVSLNLERMMEHLDLVMLENCGIGMDTVNWSRMDAEALKQKDIAYKMGNAPAIALSYTIYDIGAYLGWSLARFWGVGNWSSTMNGRLENEPEDAGEIHEIIDPLNNWELQCSNLQCEESHDAVEIRLANNSLCKENGWLDENGLEHWNRVQAWSLELLENNVGYRFVRTDELSDVAALKSENTPIILDGMGCVSDTQYIAIKEYLAQGGIAWLRLPFGTHDSKGIKRENPLSEDLIAGQYVGLKLLDNKDLVGKRLERLIAAGDFVPRIRQLSGDSRWAVRLRVHPQEIVLHIMNRALEGIPHQYLKGIDNLPVLTDIKSLSIDDKLEYHIRHERIGKLWKCPVAMSPEIKNEKRAVRVDKISDDCVKVKVDLSGIKIYSVIQNS